MLLGATNAVDRKAGVGVDAHHGRPSVDRKAGVGVDAHHGRPSVRM
jgi:hypothetical protein